jgi:hypothetical protein
VESLDQRIGAEAAVITAPRSFAWVHPFATFADEPLRSPPAIVARLRPSEGTSDPLCVATVAAVHRVLEHAAVPHVLPIRSVERDSDGRLTLAYRCVEGVDLGTLLQQGPVPHARAFAILRQLCRALAAAHAVGIEHRALGPASILLEPQGDELDRVWIADFGIAPLFEDDDDASCLSLYPTTPERVFGGATETSEDVYLVGCVAFWLFTGAPPFVADDFATLQRRHAIEDPKRVSELALDGVPAGIDGLVARALEKVPDDRFADMRDLDAAVARVQRDCGVTTLWDDAPLGRHLPPAATGRDTAFTPFAERTVVPPGAMAPAANDAATRPASVPPIAAASPRRSARPLLVSMAGMLALAGLTLFVLESEQEGEGPIAALGRPLEPVDRVRTVEPRVTDTVDAGMSLALAATTIEEAPPRDALSLPPVPGPLPASRDAPEPAVAPPVAPATPTAAASTATPAATSTSTAIPVATTARAPEPQVPRAVAQARACAFVRRSAADARGAHDWAGLLRHASRTSCWPSDRERTRLRVKALMELGRFSVCVDAGQHFATVDPELARWVALCRKRAEGSP